MASPLLALRGALFRAGHAETVTLTRTGAGAGIWTVGAKRLDGEAGDLAAPGNIRRAVSFEIEATSLPVTPRPGDTLVAGAEAWRVAQVTPLADLGALRLGVER